MLVLFVTYDISCLLIGTWIIFSKYRSGTRKQAFSIRLKGTHHEKFVPSHGMSYIATVTTGERKIKYQQMKAGWATVFRNWSYGDCSWRHKFTNAFFLISKNNLFWSDS